MSNFANYLSPFVAREYALFISHAWDYSEEYDALVNLLNRRGFTWRNLSVPDHNPLPNLFQLPKSYRYYVRELDKIISGCDCMLVLAGMYVAHRGWIQSEIEAAIEFGKPIIAVAPRGQERFPADLTNLANIRVGWNSNSIIEAIRVNVPRRIPPPNLLDPPKFR